MQVSCTRTHRYSEVKKNEGSQLLGWPQSGGQDKVENTDLRFREPHLPSGRYLLMVKGILRSRSSFIAICSRKEQSF
jgi:hypothetical protein